MHHVVTTSQYFLTLSFLLCSLDPGSDDVSKWFSRSRISHIPVSCSSLFAVTQGLDSSWNTTLWIYCKTPDSIVVSPWLALRAFFTSLPLWNVVQPELGETYLVQREFRLTMVYVFRSFWAHPSIYINPSRPVSAHSPTWPFSSV